MLRCTKFSESSLIVLAFTEMFGTQSYIIKGIRKTTRKQQNQISFFQPAAILHLEMYHHPLKNLQYIKEFEWANMYNHIFFDVSKNAIASFMMEVLQHTLKQPEENPELFDFLERSLIYLDNAPLKDTANLPIYFLLKLGQLLGFQLGGHYSEDTPVLDLQAGEYVQNIPGHILYLAGEAAASMAKIKQITDLDILGTVVLNQAKRRVLLQAALTYINIHTEGMGELKSLPVLQQLLS